MTEVVWAVRADDAAVADCVAAVLARPGRKTIAVPGGRTPAPILEKLARRPLPWGTTEVTLTDDRLVPENHPASNFGLLSRALDATAAGLHQLVEGAAPPRFDLVWLGMGEDGHVASIFPGSGIDPAAPPAVVRTRPDPLPPEAPYERLTLTYAALAAADDMILVVRGGPKRAILEQAIAGGSDLPIARLLRVAACPVSIFWSKE